MVLKTRTSSEVRKTTVRVIKHPSSWRHFLNQWVSCSHKTLKFDRLWSFLLMPDPSFTPKIQVFFILETCWGRWPSFLIFPHLKTCLSTPSNSITHNAALGIERIQIGCKQSTIWDDMLMLDSSSLAPLNLQIHLKWHLNIFFIH